MVRLRQERGDGDLLDVAGQAHGFGGQDAVGDHQHFDRARGDAGHRAGRLRVADAETDARQAAELERIATAAAYAASLGLKVNAGHGLTYHNVQAIARIPEMHELNIGHALIAQAVFLGLPEAIKQMKEVMYRARISAGITEGL